MFKINVLIFLIFIYIKKRIYYIFILNEYIKVLIYYNIRIIIKKF
jgi:hypothetical protein